MKDKILIEALQSYVVSLKLEIDDLKSQLKEKATDVKAVQQTKQKRFAVIQNTKPIVVEEKAQEVICFLIQLGCIDSSVDSDVYLLQC